MKKPKTSIIKLKMIKPLYEKFHSYAYVGERLGLNHTTVMYWLGKLKTKKPKREIESMIMLPEDYYKQLNIVDADTPNPKECGAKLREEYKSDFGVYPDEYGKNPIKMQKMQ